MRMKIIAAAAFVAFASVGANAAVVSGLYNTGLGVGGVAFPAGDGQQDANYIVTASTVSGVNPGDPTFTYYNPAYAAENAGSRWISYSGSPFAGVGGFRVGPGAGPDRPALELITDISAGAALQRAVIPLHQVRILCCVGKTGQGGRFGCP